MMGHLHPDENGTKVMPNAPHSRGGFLEARASKSTPAITSTVLGGFLRVHTTTGVKRLRTERVRPEQRDALPVREAELQHEEAHRGLVVPEPVRERLPDAFTRLPPLSPQLHKTLVKM